MKARFRDLTAKYKDCRSQPDTLFLSRNLQSFFNKFTKKGKKATARRHLRSARRQFRSTRRVFTARGLLSRTLRHLESPLSSVYRRKGNARLVVPVPARRNKKKSAGLQTLYNSRQRRRERNFSERLFLERNSIAGPIGQSPVGRAYSDQALVLYESRIYLDRR